MDLLDTIGVQTMTIPVSIKQQACEGLLHFCPKKVLARELGVSNGAIRDWSIFIENGNFAWIHTDIRPQNKPLLHKAVHYWLDNYPIGYSDVARHFGLRPASVYHGIQRHVKKLPVILRPKRIRYWDTPETQSIGLFKMEIKKLSDIPEDRPLTLAERKALFKELEEARGRLICAESLLEVAVESCKDELKKKELMRQLEQTRKVLASLSFAK